MFEEILKLKEQQKKIRDEKLRVTKDLHNAERRRSRLKKRAKALSDSDLLAVMSLRLHERSRAVGATVAEEASPGESHANTDGEATPSTAASSASGQSPSRRRKTEK